MGWMLFEFRKIHGAGLDASFMKNKIILEWIVSNSSRVQNG